MALYTDRSLISSNYVCITYSVLPHMLPVSSSQASETEEMDVFLYLLDEVYQESVTYRILHSLFFYFIVITGQRVGRVIILMQFSEKLGPEIRSVLLDVTELQMGIWMQVSLTPEPKGSSSPSTWYLLKSWGMWPEEQEEVNSDSLSSGFPDR